MSENNITNMPLLALRGLVIYPEMMVHFDVVRKKSIDAINAAMSADRSVFLITQKNISADDPTRNDLYDIGCVAKVKQILRMSDDVVRVLVEGCYRAELVGITDTDPTCRADVERIYDAPVKCRPVYKDAMLRNAKAAFDAYAAVAAKIPPDVLMTVVAANDMGRLADYVAHNIPFDVDDKQYILEQHDTLKRLKSVITLLKREREIASLDDEINEKVRVNIDDNQREYYLREQIKVINEELYGQSDTDSEYNKYYDKIDALRAEPYVKERLCDEVDRLMKMPQGSHESTVVLNYLDTCLSLPWGIYTDSRINLLRSAKILDREHYGLKKVKERILELLAVHSLVPDIKGQIICLVGPPGVGKTSIVRSIAECMGRKYARVSLGGITDEAEIRGHRKTYIGAMPGRMINAVKSAGSANPVILLDEIDKLGSSFKGDPASAMLEILDSEQNSTFYDHYIDMPFDLSRVLFITTANDAGAIPGPLLDRMELIELGSYTREEKFHIAKEHLIKKQLAACGLKAKQVRFTDEVIYKLIDSYTREAGVRRLDRTIASVCRKSAARIVTGDASVKLNDTVLCEMLGSEKYRPETAPVNDEVGMVNGLAWTSVGGVLMPLEVVCVPGSGQLSLTGSLGDVMKESAKAAVTCVRSRAELLGIDKDFYKNLDIHIHAPEAAVPKDGPSAGTAMFTAIVSALTGSPVRHDVAMTGEITLRGKVMPIGGLKEKTMAAYRAGIKKVLIPKDNIPDLDEIDETVKDSIIFVPVESVDSVLSEALLKINVPQKKVHTDTFQIPDKAKDNAVIPARQ